MSRTFRLDPVEYLQGSVFDRMIRLAAHQIIAKDQERDN